LAMDERAEDERDGLAGAAVRAARTALAGVFADLRRRDVDLAIEPLIRLRPAPYDHGPGLGRKPERAHHVKCSASLDEMMDGVEPGETHQNEIDRHDVAQEPRHEQNQNAGNQRNDRCDVGGGDDHG
jgi:hypothetical protein